MRELQADSSRKIDGRNLLRDDDPSKCQDTFFSSEVLDVKLGLGGVETQQSLLIQERVVDDWRIFRCTNCDLDTHAVHKVKGLDRVIGNLKLQRSSEDVATLKSNSQYSPVFKVVLDTNSWNDKEEGSSQTAFILQHYLSQATQLVNNMMKKYLKIQEDAMQERIRLFVEQEKQKFQELQDKAAFDKKSFLRVLCRKEEKNMKDTLSDAMRESPFRIGSAEERDNFAMSIPTYINASRGNQKLLKSDQYLHPTGSLPLSKPTPMPSRVLGSKPKESPSKRIKSPTKQQPVMRRRVRADVDEDTLFDLEGFQDNKSCQPFFESDEDSSGDSNSLESSGGFGYPIYGRGFAGDRVYATSVPVGIPYMEIQRKQSYEDEEDEQHETAPSPERMAESIKAIARSIQDSTSMFGDLPRPRYNTMPLK